MSLRTTLDALAAHLEQAPTSPFSNTCKVPRADLMALIEQARGQLPVELGEARGVLSRRDELLDEAQREAQAVRAEAERMSAALVDGAQSEAEGIVDDAQRMAEELIASSRIVARAQGRASEILAAARAEAARLLREADEYCDRKLGDLEGELDATIGQVRRGRGLLRERSSLDRQPELAREPVAFEPPSAEDVFDGAAHDAPAEDAEAAGTAPPAQRRVLDLTELEEAADPQR